MEHGLKLELDPFWSEEWLRKHWCGLENPIFFEHDEHHERLCCIYHWLKVQRFEVPLLLPNEGR